MAYASYTTSSHTDVEEDRIIRYRDCKIVKNGGLVEEDVFIRKGKILNPKKLFFEERKQADIVFDCDGLIVSPGFIDIQVNGGFGHDFSRSGPDVFSRVDEVSRKLLKYGVTSFCPTIVTSPPSVYQEVLPQFCTTSKVCGANVLGVHLEGPFINIEKKGAHCADYIRDNVSPRLLEECYGTLDNVVIVTLAPELRGSLETVEWLTKEKNIAVSLGHSMSDLSQAEVAVCHGASLITHLFNAMLPFHHRDPGLVGLLTSKATHEKPVYYGLIADKYHTHPAAIKIAYKSNSQGIVLITDSIAATGLPDGSYKFGEQNIFVDSNTAKVAGTNVLAGSVATMDVCVRNFLDATGCTKAEALEAASLHPAMALGIDDRKGKLDVGFDADLVLLEESTLKPVATVLAGRLVWIEDSLKKTWNLKNQ